MITGNLARISALAIAAAACFATAANATIYTSRSAWQAAVTGQTTIDFEGITSGFFTSVGSPFASGGASFALGPDSNGTLYVSGANKVYIGTSVLDTMDSTTGKNSIVITLPSLYGAIGMDFGDSYGASLSFCDVTPGNPGACNNAASQPYDPNNPVLAFFGYIAGPGDDPISAIKVTGPSRDFNLLAIDKVSFANAVVSTTGVPEPLTISLFGAGLLGGTALRRRRRGK